MWFSIVKSNPNERAIELIKDIVERNPEFSIVSDDMVIIVPSWLPDLTSVSSKNMNANISWSETIKTNMGVGDFYHKGDLIPKFYQWIEFFSFRLDDVRNNNDEIIVYIHTFYYYYKLKFTLKQKICLWVKPNNYDIPIGDFYASLLLHIKDKDRFESLWG